MADLRELGKFGTMVEGSIGMRSLSAIYNCIVNNSVSMVFKMNIFLKSPG